MCFFRTVTSIGALSAIITAASAAHAQLPPLGADESTTPAPTAAAPAASRVPLTIDIEGPVRVTSGGATEHCSGPCTLQVVPGFVEVKAGDMTQELYVERASRVAASPGAPALRRTGFVVLAAGVVVVLATTIIPLAVCQSDRHVDQYGVVRDRNPCRDLSDGFKVGWIAAAGIGLTATIAGAIVYGTSGPKLELAPLAASAARSRTPHVGVAPWLTVPSAATSTAAPVGAGAVLFGRF